MIESDTASAMYDRTDKRCEQRAAQTPCSTHNHTEQQYGPTQVEDRTCCIDIAARMQQNLTCRLQLHAWPHLVRNHSVNSVTASQQYRENAAPVLVAGNAPMRCLCTEAAASCVTTRLHAAERGREEEEDRYRAQLQYLILCLVSGDSCGQCCEALQC